MGLLALDLTVVGVHRVEAELFRGYFLVPFLSFAGQLLKFNIEVGRVKSLLLFLFDGVHPTAARLISLFVRVFEYLSHHG